MKAALDQTCNAEFGTEPDCTCPHEHWHVGAAGACLDIHIEPEGFAHVILYGGAIELEVALRGISTLSNARPIAFLWAATVLGDRLFAAAPDMLDALIELWPDNLGDIPAHLLDSDTIPIDVTVGELRKAKAAIDKARGEA